MNDGSGNQVGQADDDIVLNEEVIKLNAGALDDGVHRMAYKELGDKICDQCE